MKFTMPTVLLTPLFLLYFGLSVNAAAGAEPWDPKQHPDFLAHAGTPVVYEKFLIEGMPWAKSEQTFDEEFGYKNWPNATTHHVKRTEEKFIWDVHYHTDLL